MRDFHLSVFGPRESYERALDRAGEIMANLRVARPAATVMYRIFWLDGSTAIRSTAAVVFFNRRAFASDVTSREDCSADYGPLQERGLRPRILKVTIVSMVRGAAKTTRPKAASHEHGSI